MDEARWSRQGYLKDCQAPYGAALKCL